MKERPILFSAPMVRALPDGSKTQTRRPLKLQPPEWVSVHNGSDGLEHFFCEFDRDDDAMRHWPSYENGLPCPYGQPGDRLWVRETFFAYGRWETRYSEKKRRDEWHFVDMTLECDRAYQYAADNPDVPLAKGRGVTPGWWTRPAIFMPRAASRTLLEVAPVRVERLNDCSKADAIAEGIDRVENNYGNGPAYCDYRAANMEDTAEWFNDPVNSYKTLWESINGACSWVANPWVWVVEFKRVTP